MCKVDGCSRDSIARKMCLMHYKRWRNHGNPAVSLRPRSNGCKIEGCGNLHRARGWCKQHYQENWFRSNREQSIVYANRERMKRIQAEGSFTRQEFEAVKIACGYRCVKCGIHETAVGVLHADHILPLSKGGTNYISNIQPLCPRDNRKKGNRESIDYRPRREGNCFE